MHVGEMDSRPSPSVIRDVGQLVFPCFQFGRDDPKRALAWTELGVGGFCLYHGSPREVADLAARLQARARAPLLFCGDYEDGVASHCPGATSLPSNMGLGAAGRDDLARLKAEVTAAEARAMGVRWVLAPVVDLAVEPSNPIVNVRSFGSDPALVTRLARAYLSGLRRGGVLGCLKHFPGHGRTRKDSHLELPLLEASRKILEREDLVPYRRLAQAADSVMLGHLAVPSLGGGREPFTLAPAARRLLRGRLGFKGLVSTDALDMRAISRHYDETDAAMRALRAGADVLLVPRDPARLIAGLRDVLACDPRARALAAESLRRLRRAKKQAGLWRGDPGPDRRRLAAVGGRSHQAVAQRLFEACLAWSSAPALLRGRRLCYGEPGVGNRQWRGRAFVAELRRLGARVRPADGHCRAGEFLVLGSFMRPRAYSGRIGLDPATLAEARRLLSGAPEQVVAAFGSPFVVSDLRPVRGLCAFSASDGAQRAAARALWGAIPVTGRMPVRVA
ncbi:MAG TPA: hypothetical protein DEB40_09860 [Elusimicrobia bacterium]|nr:hypothetical protein [Elusimicrobiota bacterium]HBT62035.1 hypothetical protein [Elusimicrobiota bacterium]